MAKRASFKFEDGNQGSLRFQEGTIRIDRSFATIYQYPPNRKDGTQSDPFPAIVWQCAKLNADQEPMKDGEGNEAAVEVVHRVLDPWTDSTMARPGKLAPKDYDNLSALPEDLGSSVGVEGNCLVLDEGATMGRDWTALDASMRKNGFKAEIAGRGVATDYEGTVLHLHTVKGEKYIAKSGKNAGKEQEPTHLECDKIFVYGYDQKKPAQASSKGAGVAVKPGANGQASSDALTLAKEVFMNLTEAFHTKVPVGKDVPFTDFKTAFTMELMRQNGKGVNKSKLGAKAVKELTTLINNGAALMQLAVETEQFSVQLTDDERPEIVTFL